MSDIEENDVTGRRTWTPYEEPEATVTRDDVLSASPFDGDLETELAAAPRARRRLGLTAYLGAGALLAAGFGAGAQVDRHFGDHTTTAVQGSRGSTGGQLPGGRGTYGGGMPGGGRPSDSGDGVSSGTTGTVQKVTGTTIYVKTANGVVQVKVTGKTKVRVLRSGKASALKTGTTVTVQGSQASDGTLTATSVQGTSSGR
ncbi:DUF5666 domain-containing protein [Actinoallomurus soli]|uniref:DUF5666 domain-containing protein n=1 Tax=Actinoallomurus soli TaxID=2952535 RepID=UPI002093A01A|nr:DUF5666 domain-containing protein [Actinoallomurus soli]MCO5968157.1 DUF5666 domain-containing protein [Actinoallomurus soli]